MGDLSPSIRRVTTPLGKYPYQTISEINYLGEINITFNLWCNAADGFSQGTCQVNGKNGITNQKLLPPNLVQTSTSHFENYFVPGCHVHHPLNFLEDILTWD